MPLLRQDRSSAGDLARAAAMVDRGQLPRKLGVGVHVLAKATIFDESGEYAKSLDSENWKGPGTRLGQLRTARQLQDSKKDS